LSVQLVFKNSNQCAPDPATLQTDRETDDMQSQYRALHYSASHGKNKPTKIRRVELVYRIGLLVCGINYKLIN